MPRFSLAKSIAPLRSCEMAVLDFRFLFGTAIVGLFTLLVWRRYFSPISDVPGPFVASFTRLWHMHRILKGDQNLELIRLHETHGDNLPFVTETEYFADEHFSIGHFVRVSYDEVSVTHPDAIKKILLAQLHKVSHLRP